MLENGVITYLNLQNKEETYIYFQTKDNNTKKVIILNSEILKEQQENCLNKDAMISLTQKDNVYYGYIITLTSHNDYQ